MDPYADGDNVFINHTPGIVKEFVLRFRDSAATCVKKYNIFLDISPFTVKMHGFRTNKSEVNESWQK